MEISSVNYSIILQCLMPYLRRLNGKERYDFGEIFKNWLLTTVLNSQICLNDTIFVVSIVMLWHQTL